MNDLNFIIDAHTHLASTRYIPKEFFRGIAANIRAKLSVTGIEQPIDNICNMLLLQHQDHQGDTLVSEMDAAGIDQSVLLLPDYTYVFPGELSIEEMIEEHIQVCERHAGRFHLFIGIDPRFGAKKISLLEQYAALGKCQGLKLYPPCGYSPSDKLLYPYYEICAKYNLPVLLHIGHTSPVLNSFYAHPIHLEQAAIDFPTVNFILAHAATAHTEACISACSYRPNVFMDISGYVKAVRHQSWQDNLKYIFDAGINHKILFGTDWPVFKSSGGQAENIRQMFATEGPLAELSKHDKALIMGKNIMRILPEKATLPINHPDRSKDYA